MINRMRRCRTCWWYLMLWGIIIFIPMHASASLPLRAVILFDTSGSMALNDPKRLSQTAAQLFLDLARLDDKVGLVVFSDSAVPLIPLTALSAPVAKIPFLAQLRSLTYTGQTTDLGAALRQGLRSFPEGSNKEYRDLVLLLTDGKLDLGRWRRSEEAGVLNDIHQTLLPQYRQRGISLYTIAFTLHADQTLLREMARRSRGEFKFIQNAASLHTAFSELFMTASEAESLPLEEGRFFLDKSIREAALVLTKSAPEDRISLLTPQRHLLSSGLSHPGIDWNSTSSYDLIQLKDPTPGAWVAQSSSGVPKGQVIVENSDLNLEIEIHPGYIEPGERLKLVAFVRQANGKPPNPGDLRGLTMQTRLYNRHSEVSAESSMHGEKNGNHVAVLDAPQEPGRYALEVTANGPALSRRRRFSIEVSPPCFEPRILAKSPAVVRVYLTDACPMLRDVRINSHLIMAGVVKRTHILEPQQPRMYQAKLPFLNPGQAAEVTIQISGMFNGDSRFTLLRGPFAVSGSDPSGINWGNLIKSVASQLLAVNLGLGMIGSCGYTIYRSYLRRRKPSAKQHTT